MSLNEQARQYLEELHRLSEHDPNCQVSMYDLGISLGLERGEAGSLAESLMVDGYIELKTLAGIIAITEDGLSALGITTAAAHAALPSLGSGLFLEKAGLLVVTDLLQEIRAQRCGGDLCVTDLEELIIDLKTVEVQLLSPRPRLVIIRQALAVLAEDLQTLGNSELAARLQAVSQT